LGGYNIPAKRTIHNGTEYASQMEVRFVKLLEKHKIEFQYSVWCEVIIEGEHRFREIDFFLRRPIKPVWVSEFTNCWEIKGILQPSDYTRLKALEEQGLKTFIVLPQILEYWETYTFLSHELGQIKKKKTRNNTNIDF
jgi:hypothetical protein